MTDSNHRSPRASGCVHDIAAVLALRTGSMPTAKEALLLRRAPADEFQPGLFNMPMGHLRRGETYDHAAIRELREETGIRLRAEQLVYVGDYYLDVPKEGTGISVPFHFRQYVANLPKGIGEKDIKLSKDHTEARFIGFETLRKALYAPVVQFTLPDAKLLRLVTMLHRSFPINGSVPQEFKANLGALLSDPHAGLRFKPTPITGGFPDWP